MPLLDQRQTNILDRSMPAADQANLGLNLAELQTKHNALVAQYNALLAKLDADAGITDVNYATLLTASPIE